VAFSWIVAFGVLFVLWRFGYLLKRVLSSFSISIDALDDITYKSIAVGFPIFGLGVSYLVVYGLPRHGGLTGAGTLRKPGV